MGLLYNSTGAGAIDYAAALLIYSAKYCRYDIESMYSLDLLGNWRSAVLRSNFAVRRSPFSAGILYVFQGKWAKHDGKRASKTVLRKFPRRPIGYCTPLQL